MMIDFCGSHDRNHTTDIRYTPLTLDSSPEGNSLTGGYSNNLLNLLSGTCSDQADT